jgi:hypothetical protein
MKPVKEVVERDSAIVSAEVPATTGVAKSAAKPVVAKKVVTKKRKRSKEAIAKALATRAANEAAKKLAGSTVAPTTKKKAPTASTEKARRIAAAKKAWETKRAKMVAAQTSAGTAKVTPQSNKSTAWKTGQWKIEPSPVQTFSMNVSVQTRRPQELGQALDKVIAQYAE